MEVALPYELTHAGCGSSHHISTEDSVPIWKETTGDVKERVKF